jgi:hypothetical protein
MPNSAYIRGSASAFWNRNTILPPGPGGLLWEIATAEPESNRASFGLLRFLVRLVRHREERLVISGCRRVKPRRKVCPGSPVHPYTQCLCARLVRLRVGACVRDQHYIGPPHGRISPHQHRQRVGGGLVFPYRHPPRDDIRVLRCEAPEGERRISGGGYFGSLVKSKVQQPRSRMFLFSARWSRKSAARE